MGTQILSQLSSLINHQVDFHETLTTYLSKANSLLQLAMKNDTFFSSPPSILHDYLWALSDFVEQARKLNEDSLDFLLKDPSSGSSSSEKTPSQHSV